MPGLMPGPGDGQDLTARGRSNFYYAFLFLPRQRREALEAVYAYCRLMDDIVDEGGSDGEKRAALLSWRGELEAAFFGGAPRSETGRRLQEAHLRFGLRHEDALAVLAGCEMDLERARYATWEELRTYCYHVASAVGLLCIDVFGCRHHGSRRYAEDLGLALQLTNIIRDVAEDAERGRIYLPQEDLRAFGVSEEDILLGRRSEGMRRLLRFEVGRARTHYLRARAAMPAEDRRALVVAEIMGGIYYGILGEIERRGYDVHGERIALSGRRKMTLALLAFARGLG